MRKFLRVSPYLIVLAIVVIIWMFFKYRSEEWFSKELAFGLSLAISTLITLWYLAVSDFLTVNEPGDTRKNHQTILWLCVAHLTVVLISGLTLNRLEPESSIIIGELADTLSYGLLVPVAILLIFRTRKYMYARSLWWLIIELICPIVGMLTLGPSLLEEAEERKEDASKRREE